MRFGRRSQREQLEQCALSVSPASSGRHRPWFRVLTVMGLSLTTVGLGAVTGVPGSIPAFADTVVAGCTIVANPAASHFTDCPGADFSGADLSGTDLSFAGLPEAVFVRCTEQLRSPPIACTATDLHDVELHDANVDHAAFDAKLLGNPSIYVFATTDLPGATLTGLQAVGVDMEQVTLAGLDLSGSDFSRADLSMTNDGSDVGSDLRGANFTDANFSGANLEWADLTNANWMGADLNSATLTDALLSNTDLSGANLQSAQFTGTALVPSDQSAVVPTAAGGPATWSTPATLPGAAPGPCARASGSTFLPGQFRVTCSVVDDAGHRATRAFELYVSILPAITTTTSLPPAAIGAPTQPPCLPPAANPLHTWKPAKGSAKPPRGLKLDRATGASSRDPDREEHLHEVRRRGARHQDGKV